VPAPPESPAAPALCRLDIGSATTPGRIRTRNEDSFVVQHLSWNDFDHYFETSLIIVADGLGGHEAGDQAASLVIRTVGNYLGAMLLGALSGQIRDTSPRRQAETIAAAIKGANRNVYEEALADAACRGMAATVAAVLVWDGHVSIGHVGDCRVYHHRDGILNQVTRDQTLVARMVELGTLTPEEAANHPARNEVTQAVGKYADILPAAYQLQLQPGDCLIVATDGLHAHADNRMIADVVRKTGYSATLLAHDLVELANREGGSDNCTVVAVCCF
jgi:protein phosphatase